MGPEGTRVDIRACLGRGGFGEVYRATLTRAGGMTTEVAVKILRQDVDPGSEAVKRLRDEGRLLAALRHPAILHVHDLVLLGGRVALITEYIDGEDLDACIADDPSIPARPLLAVLAEVAAALDAAVSTPGGNGSEGAIGLVHRDIKPSNIRLGRHGEVKLLDFGIARATNVLREAQTAHNAMMGSFLYMAPERFLADAVEPPSDVYALGCVLFEGLTRQRLFEGTTLKAIFNTMVTKGRFQRHLAQRLALVAEHVPSDVVLLLQDLLQPDTDIRPTASEAASRLGDLAEGIGGVPLRRWVRDRAWREPPVVAGSLDGLSLAAEPFASALAASTVQAPQGGQRVDTGPRAPPRVHPAPPPAAAAAVQDLVAHRQPPVRAAPQRGQAPPTPQPPVRGAVPPFTGTAEASVHLPGDPTGDLPRESSEGPSLPRRPLVRTPPPPAGAHDPPAWSGDPSSTLQPAAPRDGAPGAAQVLTQPPARAREATVPADPLPFPRAYETIDEEVMPDPIPEVFAGMTPGFLMRRSVDGQPPRQVRRWAALRLGAGLGLAMLVAGAVVMRDDLRAGVEEAAGRVMSMPVIEQALAELSAARQATTSGFPASPHPMADGDPSGRKGPDPLPPREVPVSAAATSAVAVEVPAEPEPDPAPDPAPDRARARGGSACQLARRGWIAVEGDAHALALTLFDRALSTSPSNADALYGRGYALMRMGRAAEARWSLCAAIRHGGEDLRREVRSVMESHGLDCP